MNLKSLENLKQLGYKYDQVKDLTLDRHYEYMEPHFLVLIPFKEFFSATVENGIYEPIESELLLQWAKENNDFTEILIAKKIKN